MTHQTKNAMDHVIQQYGAALGLTIALLGFLATQIWPVLRDRGIPAWFRSRREADEARRRREDRIVDVLEANNRVMAELSATLRGMSGKLDDVCVEMSEIQEDMAGLYERIQAPRPSRSRKRLAVAEAPR